MADSAQVAEGVLRLLEDQGLRVCEVTVVFDARPVAPLFEAPGH